MVWDTPTGVFNVTEPPITSAPYLVCTFLIWDVLFATSHFPPSKHSKPHPHETNLEMVTSLEGIFINFMTLNIVIFVQHRGVCVCLLKKEKKLESTSRYKIQHFNCI